MFKGLLGGGRSSSSTDLRSNSSSKGERRRKSGHRSSASSTVSHKSSRGDDRDRGLGDLSAYSSPGSASRSKRYAESAAGESVASSYATAQPNYSDDRIVSERALKRSKDSEYDDRDDRDRDHYREDRTRDKDRQRRRTRSEREYEGERDRDDRDNRRRERERERTHSGDDAHFPPVASGAVPAPFDQAQDPCQPSAPENHKPQSAPGNVDSPTIYDPHVQQQFPGQFPTTFAEPYRPPNPAGEAADYYGDQGQSVQDQPGVRPKPPLVIPNSQAHLMTASPSANPPPEPSSVGEVGAAASYFAADPGLDAHTSEQPISGPQAKPPKPSKPSKPSHSAGQAAAAAAAGGAATYGLGDYSAEQVLSESPTAYATPTTTNQGKPPHSNSHGVGAAVGGVAAGAAAGYMLSHHHHSSSSASDHVSQYSMQNPDDTSQIGQGYSGAPMNPALYGVGAAGAAGAAYAASPLHPHHAAIYHGSPFQGGAMAYQQRQRGPFDKFIDFWRDPEGVGKFEDYTEEIGVCRYCFEPGSTSRNAPRPHNYGRRRSSDRISSGSRVDKLSRYGSSEDEGRRRKSSKSSWLPAILGGYAMKSLFDNKDFDDSYSVKSGQVSGAYPDSDSSASDKKSRTSRGVYKRSHRTRSQEPAGRADYYDSKPSGYEGSRIAARPRSRSRSSSRSNRHSHTLRDAAIGAAVGGAAMSMAKSHHRDRSRSNSPSRSVRKPRGRRRKSSSSSGSSFDNISRPAKNSAGGFGSFFTASSDNRNKRRNKRSKSIFSFNNSSSSSLDNDLAFGSGYAKKLIGKSKRRNSKEKKNKDVDAKLLALGATATALAASSPRRNRRTGEVFVGQGSRSGRSDYTSSASNDEDWEDLDSEGQASSVSSALAFGASASGNSSDSSSSGWGWVWGGKNKKKSKKHSGSNEKHFPTGAAAAVAAGALGTAALGSGYHRDNKAPSQAPSSSTASLQHVAPIPTSDPGRYDAAPLSSFPPSQPQLIRPGSIPLQQPQPVTPVSQAVYTTQGAPIHSYSAPVIPAFESPFPSYESQLREVEERQEDRGSSRYPQPLNELPRAERRHRRSDSTPIFQSDPIEPAPGSGLKRRSTTRDQASVSFNLTDEQEDKQRRTEHLERLKNDLGRRDRIELLDYEEDTKSAPAGYASKRYRDTEPERERERERDRDREFDRERERESESRFTKDDLKRDRDTGSWAGPVAAGAIGAVAASTVLSGKSSKDDRYEASERWRERSEQRRAERRRATDPSAMSSASSDIPERPKPREVVEERASSASPSDHVKTSAFRGVRNKKAVYDDYAAFFYPDELRYSPDSQSRRESPTMPTIVEIEPASESSREKPQEPPFDSSFEPTPDYRGFKNLPWPVPSLRVIEPTPPHSVSGSVRGTSSPIITPAEPVQVEEEPERPTGSRVSWADEDRRHEYEVPSTSSERSSIDLNERQRDSIPDATTTRDGPIDYTYIEPSHAHVEDTNDEIEFAATVAAATQAAGFDPSLVTDDPVFRTRTSPPGSDTRERSISPTTRVPAHPEQFHGYVEGEVETPEAAKPKSQFFSDETIFPGPKPTFSNSWAERGWDYGSQPSAEQPVVEHIDRVETDPADVPLPRSVIETSDIQEKPTGRYPRQESDSPGEEEFFMPGGFEPEESAKPKRRSPSPTTDAIPQSTVSYSDTREFGPEPLRRTETEGTETDQNDVAESVVGTEDGTEGKKKKRRKRRSKRESDTFDDTASVASSVATESSDKRRSMEDKGKKSGGFLSSIFGSRVSEPVESKRSPEKPVSREVQSEIGTRTFDDSSRRRRHRSSSRGDSLDGRRRYDDRELDREDNFLADKDVNVESYKSSRQRREDKRKQLYGDSEYEKEPRISQESERDQSFLVERPEMPPMDGESEYDGASGPSSSMDADGRGLGLGPLPRRPRSHSTSPPSSQKIVTDLAPRSVSPGPTMKHGQDGFTAPRRLSLSRFAGSPTAVPLHFRPPPTSPRLQRSPSISSPTAASLGSPSQGRRSRPNSVEFKHSREIRPLFLVERHGSSKMEDQLGDEPLPSLPSSKSASAEDLTVLPDQNTWESAEHSSQIQETSQPTEEPYSPHEVLGSQQNTPTRATFGPPHHLSRKQELGYEFHSPSELLQESSSYGDLPSSPAMEALPSAESSTVGVKEDDRLPRELESLPALPDSRPTTPDDKAIPAGDAQQPTTPTQEKYLPATDVPDFYSGPGFAGVVDAAVAAAHPDTAPYPDAEALAKAQRYDVEDDDTARTVTGDDVPAVEDVDATPPGSPIKQREYHDSFAERAAPWGFASVVGAAVAANKGSPGEERQLPGDFPVTTPSGDEKTPSVADTTEDEFFDAMSQDELGYEEEAWDLNLPAQPTEPVVPREVSEDLGPHRREPEPEPVPVSEPGLDAVKTEGPSVTEQGPTEAAPEMTDRVTDKAIEAQSEDVDPSTSSKKKKNKKKKKGKSIDVTDQGEDKSLEAQTFDPAPLTLGVDEKKDEVQTPAPEQVQMSGIPAAEEGMAGQVAEPERKLSVDTDDNFEDAEMGPVPELVEETPVLDEVVTVPEQTPTTDLERPSEENRSIPMEESLSIEQPAEEVAREIPLETTETSNVVDPEPTLPEEPEETASDAGLSKKAKKKKKAAKAKAAAAAAAAAAAVGVAVEEAVPTEELSAQAEDPVASQSAEPEVREEDLEPTDATRSIEDVAQPAEQPEGLVPEEPLQPTEAAEGVYAPPEEPFDRVPEDISPERELNEPAVSAEQPATESEQVHIPDEGTQESSTAADVAAPADTDPLPESNEPEQEADAPLSRKASKKDKKKKKRKGAVEAEPEAEAADSLQPEPESLAKPEEGVERELPPGEDDSKIQPREDISGDFKENITESVKNEEVAPESASDTVALDPAEPAVAAIAAAEESKQQEQDDTLGKDKDTSAENAVPEEPLEESTKKIKKQKKKKNRKSTSASESQLDPEPEMKPEDIATRPETSDTLPPLDDTQQQHEVDTKDEPADTQTAGTISEQIEGEPSQPVELSETNDRGPHVLEQPTIDPEEGEQTSTEKKSTKEDKQNVSNAPEETSLPDVVEGPEAPEPSLPTTEAGPEVPIKAPTIPDEPSTTASQDPTEEMSRGVETATESGDVAIPESQDAADAPPMTTAQKKKAKKEKKKRERQSLLLGESETPATEAVVEKELAEAPAQELIQEPEVVTPDQQEAVSKAMEQESEQQISQLPGEQVAGKISEQPGDGLVATEPPTTETTETVPEPAQDTTTGHIEEEPPAIADIEGQEGKAIELGVPAVPEEPTEPVFEDAQPVQSESTRDIGELAEDLASSRTDDQPGNEQPKDNLPSDVDATTIEPTEDIQQQTTEETQTATDPVLETPTEETQPTSKKDKKKKKKKRQSGSVETEAEAEATSVKDEDTAPVIPTELPTSDAPATVEYVPTESATKEEVVTESQPEPAGTMQEIQETEKAEELSVPTEDIPEASVEQHGSGSQDRSIPELETEETSLAEVPTPVDAEIQEQEKPAEETETASSTKKNKKKKKKSQSTSVDEEKPAPEPEPVSEKPAEPVTETAWTTVPEEAAVVSAAAPTVEETQPIKENPAPGSEELETQDLPPAEEESKASKKKAKKDKKKRKSVSFAAEETFEQDVEPSEPVKHTDSAEVKELEPTEIPVETEAADKQKEVEAQERELEPAEPSEAIPDAVPEIDVAGESKQNEEAPAQAEILAEAESAGKSLDQGEGLSVGESPSEEVVKEETDHSLPAEESTPVAEAEVIDDLEKQPESIEPQAAPEVAEVAEPETGSSKKKDKKKKKRKTLELKEDETIDSPESLDSVQEQVEATVAPSDVKEIEEPVQEHAEDPAPGPEKQEEDEPKSAKAKKKAKKDKKRQSKLLALESEPSTPTETAQDPSDDKPRDPEVSAEEVARETSKDQQPTTLGSDAPAETEISPVEDNGKENQSHDTEHHGDDDKDLTWTDNDMSSQVEKERQQTASTDPLSEHKIESEKVEATMPEDEVVEEGQEASAKLEPSDEIFTEERGGNDIEMVQNQEVEEVQDETAQTEHNKALEETAVEPKTDDNDIPVSTPEATNTMEDGKEEEIVSQPAIEAEPEKPAAHPDELESAIPSRKLSKKQKKKQRQAEKAAAQQEPEQKQEPTPETEAGDSVTVEEASREPAASEEAQKMATVTGDPGPEEQVTVAATEDSREVPGLETTDDPLTTEVAAPEEGQATASIPEDGLPQDEPSRDVAEDTQEAAGLTTMEEQQPEHTAPESTHDTTTLPISEDVTQQTEETPRAVDEGVIDEESAALGTRDVPGIQENSEESVTEELATGKSKKKNKKSKKKALIQTADASEITPYEEPPVMGPEAAVETDLTGDVPEVQMQDAPPSEVTQHKDQLDVTIGAEEGAPQPQKEEPTESEATREQQFENVPEVSFETPAEDKSPAEHPEEPMLSRKESKKKKKKAKKQAKEQEQLDESSAPGNAEIEVENINPADVAEAESLPAVEAVEASEVQRSQDEPTEKAASEPGDDERKAEMALEEPTHKEAEVKTGSAETPVDTEQADMPREVPVQEIIADEAERDILPEEQKVEPKMQTQNAEPAVEKDDIAAYTDESRSVEPETVSVPVSRKLSKKEKRKLKKQATSEEPEEEQQAAEVEPKDNITVPQATLEVPDTPQEPVVTEEPIEAVKETPVSQPELEPVSMIEHEAGTSREPGNEALIPSGNENSKDSATEPPKNEDPPLSKKLSKKEKRKKRKGAKTEESQPEPEPEQLAEPASLPGEQPHERFLEAGDVQETERRDEDAWPSIDWEKGKVDTVEQSSQSSPEAHAGAFVPEIPEFKESAIPEALLEQPEETPEEAVKESRAQPVTGTIDRDVATRDFNMPTTGSALNTLHDVESIDEKKTEETKPSKIANIFPNLERGLFRRPSPTQPVKDGAEEETVAQAASRDSAIQVSEAPIAREVEPQLEVRDSGYIASPALAQDDAYGATARELPDAKVEAESLPKRQPEILEPESQPAEPTTIPSPAEEDDVFGATSTKELPNLKTDFTSERQPQIPEPEEFRSVEQDTCELRRSPSIHGRHDHPPLPWSLDEPAQAQKARDISPPTQLPPIAEQEPERSMVRDGTPRLEMKPEHVLPRPETPVRKFTETALGRRAWPSPDNSNDDWEKIQKPSPKGLSPERGLRSEILKTPEQDKPVLRPSSRPGSATSSTHSLRRIVHSTSGDLRAAALAASPAVAPATEREHQSRPTTPQPSQGPTDLNVGEIASSSSYDPVTDKGKRPVRSMTDVYEGWGETPTSPRSPSRPASIRHRRSMQHLQELEFRLENLIQENRDIAAARDAAEDRLRNASLARRKSDQALNTRDADLRDREAELEQLQESVEWFQKEVARLNEENTGLTTTNTALIATHAQEIRRSQQAAAREVEQLRSQNERLSTDVHEQIKTEIEAALGQKNAELRRLREELESARNKVKELQEQISASMNDNVIAFRGEEYFEAACQKLCGHVQQWVLRFSKHSDHRRCRRLVEVKDEKIADRFDNAILDGSDTDAYLGDRVRRRDVFMSVVMTMVWEFVFTRYLFGMDREQRQKLKSLEKQLIEVGPRNSIHRWRATTLTLLSRRQAFAKQRESDTEAVALEIFDTLSRLLPPPTNVESQLLDSLRKVLRVAVSLSLEMRTQLAEYIMLPPLQPEFDTNGDLARQVFFNASLMNERSGETTSNEELQSQNTVVRVVLFPLVVKKGNDAGEGEDEVVVCPAQVLVARPGKDKRLSKMASGDRMSVEASRSVHSIAPSTMDMSMNMSMSNVI